MQPQPTILCLAGYFKGASFLTAAKDLGARVLLLTRENIAAEPWPRESIDEVFLMPDLRRRPDNLYAVSYLARANRIDAIVPLDDYDVETAAALREHLRLPGLGETGARYFRDKLAMRTQAAAAGIPVPPFTPVFSYDRLRAYMERVPPPWVLKPRSEAGAMGIKKLYSRPKRSGVGSIGWATNSHSSIWSSSSPARSTTSIRWCTAAGYSSPSRTNTPARP